PSRVVLGEDMAGRGRGVGVGCVPGGLDRGLDLRLHLIMDGLEGGSIRDVAIDEVRREPFDGIVVSALLDLLARTVGLVVVVRRVREEAVSLALDQGRSFARPSTVVRL